MACRRRSPKRPLAFHSRVTRRREGFRGSIGGTLLVSTQRSFDRLTMLGRPPQISTIGYVRSALGMLFEVRRPDAPGDVHLGARFAEQE